MHRRRCDKKCACTFLSICGHAGGHSYVHWICNGYRGRADFAFQASDIDISHLWLLRPFLDLRNRSNRLHAIVFVHYCIYIRIRLSNRTHSEILVVIHQMKQKWPMTKWSAVDSAACKVPKYHPVPNSLFCQ